MLYIFLSLITCLSFANTNSFDPFNELFVGRPWDFLEDQFIIKPQNSGQEINNKLKKWLPSLITGAAAGYAADSLIQNYVPKKSGDFHIQSFSRWVVDPLIGITAARMFYKFIENSIQTNIEIDVLRRFIRNWIFNKDYTPVELHNTFDHLYKQYTNLGTESDFNQSVELIRLIKNAIYRHFGAKYEYQLQDANAPFFQHTFLHTIVTLDIGQLVNSLIKVISSFNSKD